MGGCFCWVIQLIAAAVARLATSQRAICWQDPCVVAYLDPSVRSRIGVIAVGDHHIALDGPRCRGIYPCHLETHRSTHVDEEKLDDGSDEREHD